MFNTNDLLKAIKKAAMEAVNASDPADIRFGTVISESPLKIKIDQKLTLTESQLVLSRNVRDYEISVSFDWTTESVGNHTHDYSGNTGNTNSHEHSYSGTTTANGGHNHKVKSDGSKKIKIHNALKKDDHGSMVRMAGGQKYLVIDRI